jgi:hypothetical protein
MVANFDEFNRKGKWSFEEDEMLINAYVHHGKSWVKISDHIPGRTQRQCRTRFCKLEAKEDFVLPKREAIEASGSTISHGLPPIARMIKKKKSAGVIKTDVGSGENGSMVVATPSDLAEEDEEEEEGMSGCGGSVFGGFLNPSPQAQETESLFDIDSDAYDNDEDI